MGKKSIKIQEFDRLSTTYPRFKFDQSFYCTVLFISVMNLADLITFDDSILWYKYVTDHPGLMPAPVMTHKGGEYNPQGGGGVGNTPILDPLEVFRNQFYEVHTVIIHWTACYFLDIKDINMRLSSTCHCRNCHLDLCPTAGCGLFNSLVWNLKRVWTYVL